jgi:Tachylectin
MLMKKTITNLLLLVLLFVLLVNIAFSQTGQTGEPLYISGVPIYAVEGNGDLLWYSHQGFQDGSISWANKGVRKKVGEGWAASLHIFKGNPRGVDGEDGIVYRVDTNGDLYWYKHRGYISGSTNWVEGKKVGVGWKVKHAFAGGGGIIYVIDSKGDLYWFKHLGYQNGAFLWANDARGKKIANGTEIDFRTGGKIATEWKNARFVFSGGSGVIYLIDKVGDLYWYKHTGFLDGSERWQKRKKIGRDWQTFRQVFSGGGGIIYAVNSAGTLYWYKHADFAGGASTWVNKSYPRKIGESWVFNFVF